MARLSGNINFTGRIGNLSAYKMRGVEEIVLRQKGGPTKKQIKTAPNFANTRRINSEWQGCTKSGSYIRRAMWHVTHLSDHNFQGSLNALAKVIQTQDKVSAWGKRAVYLSQNRGLLQGFNLNKRNLFDSILRHPLYCSVSHDRAGMAITVPPILPGISFFNPAKHPMFRLCFVLGMVPDIVYGEPLGYQAADSEFNDTPNYFTDYMHSDWLHTRASYTEQSYNLRFQPDKPVPDACSLMLTAGIEFGTPVSNDTITPTPYSGSAKVLAVW